MTDEDDESIVGKIRDRIGYAESLTSRSTERDCDECGESEGSVTIFKGEDVALCRSCYNDPDVLNEYVG